MTTKHGEAGSKIVLVFDRFEEGTFVGEVTQNRVGIGLCDRNRRDGFVGEVEEVAVALLAKHRHLLDVHDVFSVASDQSAVFETLFHSLQTAAQHVLLEVGLVVCVPDLYVVVV